MKMKIYKLIFTLAILVGFTIPGDVVAKESENAGGNAPRPFLMQTDEGTGGNIAYVNINGIASFFDRDGITGFNTLTDGSGTYYPRGQVGVIYRDGLVWGGLMRDPDDGFFEKRVGGNTYTNGTIPGKIVNGEAEDYESGGFNSVWRVFRVRNDWQTITDDVIRADAADVYAKSISSVTQLEVDAIRAQYRIDWIEWPTERGAPYYDVDEDGTYNPVTNDNGPILPQYEDGALVAGGDYPGYANGDQVLWYVINDKSSRAVDMAGSNPFGLEIQTTVWGYNLSTEASLGNAFFKRYLVYNKSGKTIDSLYFAQWSDPDLGAYSNDFVGVDSSLSLMFAYNGTPTDADFAQFGYAPAAAGYDFLQGPLVDAPGDSGIFNGERVYDKANLGSNAFSYFTAGGLPFSDPVQGDYAGTKQWYNMLQGFGPTDTDTPTTPYTDAAGNPTFYPLAGKPWLAFGPTNDIDGVVAPPGDRRMNISTGPISMVDGEVQEIVVGEIAALSISNISSTKKLIFYDRAVQETYDNFFEVAKPPAAPSVRATPLGDDILLDWGFNAAAVAATEQNTPEYNFEGYNVYQYDPTGAPIKIATIDVSNGVLAIFQEQFDDNSGEVLRVPVQIGSDTGIERFFLVDKDYYTGGRLAPGHEYRFAVTAYNVATSDVTFTQSVENSLGQIAVFAQPAVPGDDYGQHTTGEMLDVEHVNGTSTGTVEVRIVDPAATTGNTYRVDFVDPLTYNVTNTATGEAVLEAYKNVAFAGETPADSTDTADQGIRNVAFSHAVDGFQIRASGVAETAVLSSEVGVDYSTYPDAYLTRVNWGGEFWSGGVDYGYWFFGSSIDDGAGGPPGPLDVFQLSVVFQDSADVAENGNRSLGRVYNRGGSPNYSFGGIGELPFEAFDVTDPANPRKIKVSFIEVLADGWNTANLLWDMGWDPATREWTQGLGAREYLFFHAQDYDAGVNPIPGDDNILANAGSADVAWAMWPAPVEGSAYLQSPFTFEIPYAVPAASAGEFADVYEFATAAPTVNDQALKESAFDQAQVFPNPYYAYNTQETSSANRFVTIARLPENVTVRIFSMAGALVRVLNDENKPEGPQGQFMTWDLKNESGLPVASGLYIYHIEAHTLGKTKVLKSFIIQPKQKLRFF
jgi:hypothetical protein